MWQEFGLVLCWCQGLGRGFEVEVHRALHADGLVWSDAVEGLSVGLDFGCEGRPVGDVDAVQVLVFQAAECRSRTPFCPGDLRLVRMWMSSGLLAMNAANPRDLKAGPLSVTRATGRISPVVVSVSSQARVWPMSASASSIARLTAVIGGCPARRGISVGGGSGVMFRR